MTVHPSRSIVSPARLHFSRSADAGRKSPRGWLRQRRMSAAENRAVHRLDQLGPEWHVVAWPHSVPMTRDSAEAGKATDDEYAGFLAVGPGGVFSVTVVQHGRSRILIAGDVVQVGNRRHPYTAIARKDAQRAARAISAAIGHEIVVQSVLAFVGSGNISVYGVPKDCMLTTYRELDRMLASTGHRIGADTAEKLAVVARSPRVWINAPYRTDSWAAIPPGRATSSDTSGSHE